VERLAIRGGDSDVRDSNESSFWIAFALVALVVCLGVANGGFFQSTWNWCLVVAAVVVLATVRTLSLVQLNRCEWLAVCLLLAFGTWTLVAGAWAQDPAASRIQANRLLLYLSFFTVALLATRSAGSLVGGTMIGIIAINLYALAAYLVVGNTPLPEPLESYLLFRPVGYANALGVLAAMGLVAALGLAAEVEDERIARACAATWAPLTATLVLTQSRGAWLAFLLGISVVAVVLGWKARPTLLMAAPVIAATAAFSWFAHLERLDHSFNLGRARALALAIVALSAVAYLAWPYLRDLFSVSSRRFAIAIATCLILALGLVATLALSHSIERLGVRQAYWRVAWHLVTHHTLSGAGPGAFAAAWQRLGDGTSALNAHNLYLETLAETGLIGLLLLMGFFVVPVVARRSTLQQRYVATALGAYTVFLSHMVVDWDWQMPVVAISGLAFGAALLVVSRSDTTPALGTAGRHRLMLASIAVLAIAVGELISR